MEFANDFGLRDTSGGSEAEVPAPAPPPNRPVVEEDEPPTNGGCICGECVRCKLRQMRDEVAHQERATAWGPTGDVRAAYAEAAARQLEAQIDVLSGKVGGGSRSVEVVSAGRASGASARSSPAESGAVPDWLVEMIQEPEAAADGVASLKARRRNNISRGTQPRGGGGGLKPAGPPQQKPWGGSGSTPAKRSHGSEAVKRPAARMPRRSPVWVKPQAKTKPSAAAAKMSMDQVFAMEMAKLQQSQPGGHVATGACFLSEDSRMPPSSAGSASPKRSARGTAAELGFADDSLAGSLGPPSPGSPKVWHPRPWSPPAKGSLHSAPKLIEMREDHNPRDRRQKVKAAVPGQQKQAAAKKRQGATTNRHARNDGVGLLDERAGPAVARAGNAGGRRSAGGSSPGGSNAGDGLPEEVVRELARLRIDNESLYRQLQASESEQADQKATFRSQLARVRQRSKVLEEQVIALTADNRRGWAPPSAEALVGGGRVESPRGGRNVGFEIPSRPR